MISKDFICTKCPMGCPLTVEDSNGIINVYGFSCNLGKIYGENEYKNPLRTITTSIKISTPTGTKVISVKTNKEVPKPLVMECLSIIKKSDIQKDKIQIGDVLIYNINNLGINVVATRNA